MMADETESNFKVCVCGAALEVLNQNGLVTRREWKGLVSDIHYCRVCDHVQFHPIPSKSVMDNFYGAEFFQGASAWGEAGYTAEHSAYYWSDTSGHLPHTTFLDLLRRLRKGNFRYGVPAAHDFGCGHGALVSRLAEFGFDASGSDPDEIAVREARRQHPAISLGSVVELAARKEQYDLITCYHSLEHLPAPYEFLEAARNALRPGGLLVLALPSGGYGPARRDYFGKYDWCFFPAHLHYFSPRSLRMAAVTTGFEIRVCSRIYG
jgi:SAM-dependent methyltransferase